MTSLISDENKDILLRVSSESLENFIKKEQLTAFINEVTIFQTKSTVSFDLMSSSLENIKGYIVKSKTYLHLRKIFPKKDISSSLVYSYFKQDTLEKFSHGIWWGTNVKKFRFESESWILN